MFFKEYVFVRKVFFAKDVSLGNTSFTKNNIAFPSRY